MELRCETCRHFYGRGSECRINPPTFHPQAMDFKGSWPMVLPSNWCGEHQEPYELTVLTGETRETFFTTPTTPPPGRSPLSGP